jgi:hypothetical protein
LPLPPTPVALAQDEAPAAELTHATPMPGSPAVPGTQPGAALDVTLPSAPHYAPTALLSGDSAAPEAADLTWTETPPA